jgi:hypothetical protein
VAAAQDEELAVSAPAGLGRIDGQNAGRVGPRQAPGEATELATAKLFGVGGSATSRGRRHALIER